MFFDVLSNFLSQVVNSLVIAEALSEFIIHFRNVLALEVFNLHGVFGGFACQSFFRIVRSVRNGERFFISDFHAEQIVGEFLQRGFAAYFCDGFLRVDRLIVALDCSRKRNLCKITLLDGTVLDHGSKLCHVFLKPFQRFVDLGFLHCG